MIDTDPTAPEPKTPRAWKTWQLVAAVLVALLIGVGIGQSGTKDDGKVTSAARSEDADDETTSTTERKRTTTTVRRTTTTTEAPYVPAPADFALTVVVVEQDCFGSAGCNVTYELDLVYNGPRPLDREQRFLLLYEVSGGDDRQVENLEIEGTSYQSSSETISTPPNPNLTAAVTSVRER